jgi:hypothetical protein
MTAPKPADGHFAPWLRAAGTLLPWRQKERIGLWPYGSGYDSRALDYLLENAVNVHQLCREVSGPFPLPPRGSIMPPSPPWAILAVGVAIWMAEPVVS